MTHGRQPRARSTELRPLSVRTPSVLVMTHSHPRLTRGGAEISAQSLFRQIKANGGRAWFLGCSARGSEARLGASLTQPFGADDYLYTPSVPFDYFKFANPDPHFPAALAELVGDLRPDIVHAHHYTRFGVEMFCVIKRASPTTRVVVSLHEYLAICNNHGQMVKTGSNALCERATTTRCAECFPHYTARDFFLRRRYIQTFFDDVDLFLAPSQFLADRYIAWGVPAARIALLENMPPDAGGAMAETPLQRATDMQNAAPALAAKPSASGIPLGGADVRRPALGNSRPAGKLHTSGDLVNLPRTGPLRVGFFGQMSPLKGISLLIEAARMLAEMKVETLGIEIHGEYGNQPEEFQASVRKALAEAGSNVIYHGPYDNADVQRLMRRMDAVVVPSTWWENSPVVIQEAFACGRPVICANIGGMAEKVRHGIDGLHFEAGRAASLAHLLAGVAQYPDILSELAATVAKPLDQAAALQAHMAAYARVMA
jgi:glycosyltransferase involved in cell wall biosynthesis